MKRICILTLILCFAVCGTASCDDGFPIPQDRLPASVTAFLEDHFPGQTLLYVERDGLEYEAHFNNGWEVTFSRSGEWRHVDCQRDAVPASVLQLLPQKLLQYLETNFSGLSVVDVEKNARGYEIGLSRDIDLKFSLSGEFRRFD